jgi:phosphoglycolate phosphatase-like HAD superfamily hydrolase
VATVAVLWGVAGRAELEAERPDLVVADATEVLA